MRICELTREKVHVRSVERTVKKSEVRELLTFAKLSSFRMLSPRAITTLSKVIRKILKGKKNFITCAEGESMSYAQESCVQLCQAAHFLPLPHCSVFYRNRNGEI